MKASTANRILVAAIVGFGAFALLLFLTGSEEAGEFLRYTLAFGLTVGGISWLGYHFRVLPRRDSFGAQTRELGLRPAAGDPHGLLDRPFHLFHRAASARDIENTASGTWAGMDVTIADYWFAPTSDTERDDYQRYTCVLVPAPPGWPGLSVEPEGLVSRIEDALALPDIEMESERFNRRFEVRSTDRRFASALIDARMMEWLLEQVPGVGFEVLGGTLMVFRPRVTTSVDDVARAVDLYRGFLQRVPKVVLAGQLDPTR